MNCNLSARATSKGLCNHKKSSPVFGFTLIEVMLAMAIFAIAGVALLGSAKNSLSNFGQLEQKTVAQWVASNQLVAASLVSEWPPKNNLKGKVEMSGVTWFWRQKVVRTTDKNMRQITMEIRINEKDEQPITSLVTFIAKSGK
ncbi:type II secretion system minor pseudopilin GspI [Thalassotalea atypica]|uniref:type II secretion system minor pseudopilin GspI n=1 Tax=Thalassotalea atypica TaxID=2054316 RepID=UPI002573A0BD|nr:type II secretion system minor pseudopilin GspI [Thalassotalea atypica]